MTTNERLAALMIEAGYLDRDGKIGKKRFARAVTEAPAALRSGRAYNHTYVGRWLSGVTPRDDETRDAIREALGARLGRIVALDELGFRIDSTVSPDVGLTYPEQPEEGVASIADLLGADLSGNSVAESSTNIAAWNDASVAWLVRSQKPLAELPGPATVGAADVVRLRAMRQTFDRLDNMFGGAHARNALVQYLRTDLPRLLRASGAADVRRDLFAAAGELVQLAAWMSYDAGLHGLAQRYFIQALSLADAAEDRLLAASILDAMSHQASFLGRYREAANMARAARLGTESIAAPILTAHFHTMEARALARTSDPEACQRAMGSAVDLFDRHVAGDGPEWIQYFDSAEMSAELGHCYRDLGRSDEAIRHATDALASASGDYARSDFFVAMVLADAHLDRGEVDEGCRVAEKAILVGETLDSVRCRTYVTEFQQRLVRYRRSGAVREFVSRVHGSRLWTPSAS
ncbi:XRE family transcriptional regulator [Pseudonocardia alaniniphila]|uniref:XRE family transcriptional regulator n=1 Tax=Pseudonocardia alaniniphila TaxID=75291 RepID=A0ABS9T9J5_9PSEU|nr:XRE family transcriptional regulator [Pseudonocardia alaniniphila]MCH6165161.1 XRE family transcriptional regulator [Pseudonocardia alaniniphila]